MKCLLVTRVEGMIGMVVMNTIEIIYKLLDDYPNKAICTEAEKRQIHMFCAQCNHVEEQKTDLSLQQKVEHAVGLLSFLERKMRMLGWTTKDLSMKDIMVMSSRALLLLAPFVDESEVKHLYDIIVRTTHMKEQRVESDTLHPDIIGLTLQVMECIERTVQRTDIELPWNQ